jgi:hypothetical protein
VAGASLDLGFEQALERDHDRLGADQLAREPREPHESAHARAELHLRDGLREEVVGARGEAPGTFGDARESRREDHGNSGGPLLRLEPGQRAEAVEPRHHHVEDDRVRRGELDARGPPAVGRGGDVVAVLGEEGLED